MTTPEQRKFAADVLRGSSLNYTVEGGRELRAVADELDPPKPREVVVLGMRFWYERTDKDTPWRWLPSGGTIAVAFETLPKALVYSAFTPTPAKYLMLWNLQHEETK